MRAADIALAAFATLASTGAVMAQATPPAIDWSKLTGGNANEVERQLLGPPEIKGDEVREPLRTPEEARAYAERVIKATQRYSAEHYAQPPFMVEDRGATWWVIASGTSSPLFAPLHVELRKSDAEIVSYGMTLKDGRVAPEDQAGDPP